MSKDQRPPGMAILDTDHRKIPIFQLVRDIHKKNTWSESDGYPMNCGWLIMLRWNPCTSTPCLNGHLVCGSSENSNFLTCPRCIRKKNASCESDWYPLKFGQPIAFMTNSKMAAIDLYFPESRSQWPNSWYVGQNVLEVSKIAGQMRGRIKLMHLTYIDLWK